MKIVPSLAMDLQCQKVVVRKVLGIIEAEFLGCYFFQWVVGFINPEPKTTIIYASLQHARKETLIVLQLCLFQGGHRVSFDLHRDNFRFDSDTFQRCGLKATRKDISEFPTQKSPVASKRKSSLGFI